jgi:hypothetical protein
MFTYGYQRYNEGNEEAIWVFEIENTTDVTGGYSGAPQHRRVWNCGYHNIEGMSISADYGGRGLGRLRLSNFINYGLYEDDDIRNSPYNLRRDFYYNNTAEEYSDRYGQKVTVGLYGVAAEDTIFYFCPVTTKWDDFDPDNTFGWATIKDWIVMRLGETYLLLAEAQYLQGELSSAATTLNVLRDRANASEISASDVTLDFILDERARELIGEENRRMTLMRTKTLGERIELNPEGSISGFDESTHLLLPIPLSEVQLTGGGLEQNPGY